ncbi:hypothetical protein P22_2032 [Propionispora sp. 2/2-37]|uniref:TetR-like C-terminal domain-containing protein n=1 Tax=Propionispora sp. 2/2-37 TaxID=1677858 RepID=UPI0006BB72DE|nr:TetR-like C-terminal domain-containing protein [Propionispora sp. 2/2-37]CUH95944.1 hypothetical protein P22_2032 [Propionispora sp. 2/2-37]
MGTRAGLSYQVLIETAANIADQSGLDNVTLTAIAEALGVRKPSLYNHIQGLPDLRRGLAVFGSRELKARISGAAIGKAGRDAIHAVAAAYRNFAHERPGLYQGIVSRAYRDDQLVKVATQELMAVLYAVLQPYHLPEHELIHAVRGLRSIMHGFVALEAGGWFAQPADREKSFMQLVDTFIRGLEVVADEH